MTFSYDLLTDVGKFRAIFPDTVEASALFQDEQIVVFLELEGDLRLARARALEVAAADVVLTLRVTEVMGLKVNGAAAAQELRAEAKQERDRAADVDALTDAGEGLFDIAEWVIDPFGAREHAAATAMRSLP